MQQGFPSSRSFELLDDRYVDDMGRKSRQPRRTVNEAPRYHQHQISWLCFERRWRQQKWRSHHSRGNVSVAVRSQNLLQRIPFVLILVGMFWSGDHAKSRSALGTTKTEMPYHGIFTRLPTKADPTLKGLSSAASRVISSSSEEYPCVSSPIRIDPVSSHFDRLRPIWWSFKRFRRLAPCFSLDLICCETNLVCCSRLSGFYFLARRWSNPWAQTMVVETVLCEQQRGLCGLKKDRDWILGRKCRLFVLVEENEQVDWVLGIFRRDEMRYSTEQRIKEYTELGGPFMLI